MSVPTARDLMTDRVLAARADWSLKELATFFTEHDISGAPVVSEYGTAIGVVSLTDLARYDSETPDESTVDSETSAFYLGEAITRDEKQGLRPLHQHPGATVHDVMMPTLFTVEEEAPIQKIADRMVRGHLHRLLVVRSGTKRDVIGIVSTIDLLEWIRDKATALA